MKEIPDDRSPMAMAMAWTSRVTTVSLEMAVPALLGYWIDEWLGTGFVFLVLGAIFGLIAGMWHLIRMCQPAATQCGEEEGPQTEEKTSTQ